MIGEDVAVARHSFWRDKGRSAAGVFCRFLYGFYGVSVGFYGFYMFFSMALLWFSMVCQLSQLGFYGFVRACVFFNCFCCLGFLWFSMLFYEPYKMLFVKSIQNQKPKSLMPPWHPASAPARRPVFTGGHKLGSTSYWKREDWKGEKWRNMSRWNLTRPKREKNDKLPKELGQNITPDRKKEAEVTVCYREVIIEKTTKKTLFFSAKKYQTPSTIPRFFLRFHRPYRAPCLWPDMWAVRIARAKVWAERSIWPKLGWCFFCFFFVF